MKTQISLGSRPVSSEASLSTRRKLGFLATHCVHSEDSDQTGRMHKCMVKRHRSNLRIITTIFGAQIFYLYDTFCYLQCHGQRIHSSSNHSISLPSDWSSWTSTNFVLSNSHQYCCNYRHGYHHNRAPCTLSTCRR